MMAQFEGGATKRMQAEQVAKKQRRGDLTPHLRIKSEVGRQRASRASSGANTVPLRSNDGATTTVRSAKRLTSPKRWEIKQLISSGVIDASEYLDLDEDFSNPIARAEVEEELDVEIREDEPPFLAGQTKRILDLSPVKIIKAPDGSLNRAAIGGVALAKERRELREQEANERAGSEARDFSAPWLDPMAKDSETTFAQDLRGKGGGDPEVEGINLQQSHYLWRNHHAQHPSPTDEFADI